MSTGPNSRSWLSTYRWHSLGTARPTGARPLAETQERQAEPQQPRVAIGRVAKQLLAAAGGDTRLASDLQLQSTTANDRDALELLLLGKVDFAVTTASLSPRNQAAGLVATPIGVELLALIVAAKSPLADISSQQMRMAVDGRAADWTLFGRDAAPLLLVVPRDEPLRDRMARSILNGDPLSGRATQVTGSRGVLDHLLRNDGAIGLVRLDERGTFENNRDIRILAVDGVRPTLYAFQTGMYPYGSTLSVVTAGAPRNAAALTIDHLRNETDLAGLLTR